MTRYVPYLSTCMNLALSVSVQFENSLGRVTTMSVRKPRQVIDVAVERPTDDKDDNTRQLRHHKELLLHIENVR